MFLSLSCVRYLPYNSTLFKGKQETLKWLQTPQSIVEDWSPFPTLEKMLKTKLLSIFPHSGLYSHLSDLRSTSFP